MKKTMKPSKIKTVAVKCAEFWDDTFDIDSSVYDDILMEAATRAVEKRKDLPGFTVAAMIECWEAKYENNPDKHVPYNTYFVFINAGMHKKAEMLRLNFFRTHKIDLQKESPKPRNDGERPNKSGLN